MSDNELEIVYDSGLQTACGSDSAIRSAVSVIRTVGNPTEAHKKITETKGHLKKQKKNFKPYDTKRQEQKSQLPQYSKLNFKSSKYGSEIVKKITPLRADEVVSSVQNISPSTPTKTKGGTNESKNIADSSDSPSSTKHIKLSHELSRRPNKFSINGSPASSKKNSHLYSNEKKSPKSVHDRSPLTFMRRTFHKNSSPDAKGVKRKLNFSSSSSELSGSQESVTLPKDQLDNELDPVNSISELQVEYKDGYLLRTLELHVDVVLQDSNSHTLISDDDMSIIKLFFSMNNECRDLFARMHNRKYKWNRLSDIRYDSATMNNLSILEKNGFFDTDLQHIGMECLLDLLKLSEMKELCKSVGIKCPTPNKKNLSEEIIHYCRQQKTISFKIQPMSSEEVVRKKIKKIIEPCFILSSEPRGLFRRIHLLFNLKFNRNEQSRHGSQDLFEIQFLGTEKSLYPNYILDETSNIFASREELLRYQKAEDLKMDFHLAVESKEWNKMETILCEIRDNFIAEMDFVSDLDASTPSVSAFQLPLSLRKYTPGSVYAYVLSEGVDFLKKLKKNNEAITDLLLLLDQTTYLPYMRGRWYEKLIIIYKQCSQLSQVVKTIRNGLQDSYVDEQGTYNLSCRTREMLKRRKGVTLEDKSLLKKLPLFPPLESVEPVEIKASAFAGMSGYRRVYVREDDAGDGKTFSSVEELVKCHYCPRTYKFGIHAENSLASSLFGILFWDVIYEYYVPSTFISPYQTRPLDLSTGEFYKNRQSLIDTKLTDMMNWTENDISSWINDLFNRQNGKMSIVHWTWFRSSQYIVDIIKCIGMEVTLKICERYAKKYRFVRSGFPDLFLWTPGQKNQYKFVEVKGPNDTLSVNQKLWLDFLVKINANVEVCLVQAHGAKTSEPSKTSNTTVDGESHDVNVDADLSMM